MAYLADDLIRVADMPIAGIGSDDPISADTSTG